MDMHWTIYLQRDGTDEKVPLARFQRPLDTHHVGETSGRSAMRR